ncbi:MAG: RNA methyltransferase [Oscillospiraceae bacterium]|nr:RNA methyltransferase [Oscillospiraceae bacterium]
MPEIIQLTSISVPELDVYARLNEAQLLHYFEPDEGIFIAESPKVIERALNAGYLPISLLMEKRHIEGEAREIISRCNVPVYTADEEILTEITGFRLTRGALCAMRRRPLPDIADVCREARRVAVLENVMNPTNVGAIFRSAAALNIDAVLLTEGCSDPLYRRAERVSMGTVFQVKWTYFDGDITVLKKLGFATAAMALDDNSVSISDPKLADEERLAIVLGTEGDGLAAKTIADCDYTVKIPMSHDVDSLNVAAASAVAFWELGKI